jgi:hypothetical protein
MATLVVFTTKIGGSTALAKPASNNVPATEEALNSDATRLDKKDIHLASRQNGNDIKLCYKHDTTIAGAR